MKKSITIVVPDLPDVAWACAGIILLLLPSLVWVVLDRTIWPWDQAWYGEVSTDLWYWLGHAPVRWATTMIDGMHVKAPGVVWLGQAFVGLRGFSRIGGSIFVAFNPLDPVRAAVHCLQNRRSDVSSGPLVHAGGVIFTAGAQLFVGLSHQYFVEPLQTVAVGWSLYLCGRVKDWPAPRLGIHLVAVLVLGALAKATTPMYFLLPVAYTAFHVFRGLRTSGLAGWSAERSSLVVLAFAVAGGVLCALWYLRHLGDVWQHVHDSSVGDLALEYGRRDHFFGKLVVWSSS
jgi:hypothetical protein